MPDSPHSPPNPARIFDALRAYQQSAVMNTAIELDVFTAVAREAGQTAAQLAAAAKTSERGMRILCDALASDGFLVKENDRYRNTPEAALFLDRKSPAFMGSMSEFISGPMLVREMFDHLTDAVRRGGTVMQGAGTVEPENPAWVTFAKVMGPVNAPSADFIASLVPSSGPLKVLDLAAGHGLFGITIAKKNPEAEIVALDWAAVLEVARENADGAGVGERYKFISGSAFDADMGTGYDVVLVTNFLHHFNAATNEALLRKLHAALKPGGRAITLEFVPDEDRVSPAVAANFAVIMLSTTQHGDAYTFRELETMYRNAGFRASECHRVQSQQSVIISTK